MRRVVCAECDEHLDLTDIESCPKCGRNDLCPSCATSCQDNHDEESELALDDRDEIDEAEEDED